VTNIRVILGNCPTAWGEWRADSLLIQEKGALPIKAQVLKSGSLALGGKEMGFAMRSQAVNNLMITLILKKEEKERPISIAISSPFSDSPDQLNHLSISETLCAHVFLIPRNQWSKLISLPKESPPCNKEAIFQFRMKMMEWKSQALGLYFSKEQIPEEALESPQLCKDIERFQRAYLIAREGLDAQLAAQDTAYCLTEALFARLMLVLGTLIRVDVALQRRGILNSLDFLY
jgi:hypothetical protein